MSEENFLKKVKNGIIPESIKQIIVEKKFHNQQKIIINYAHEYSSLYEVLEGEIILLKNDIRSTNIKTGIFT